MFGLILPERERESGSVVTSDGFPQVQQTVHPINDLEERKVSSINRYCQHETGRPAAPAACLPLASNQPFLQAAASRVVTKGGSHETPYQPAARGR